MSVRRLADDGVQPAAFAFSAENRSWAEAQLRKYPEGRQQSAVIPLLMRAQEQEGWVTKAAIEGIADMLGMPYIRALEVATFYTQFQLKPVGTKAHVQVCGTTPCMLRGSEELIALCRSKINAAPFETNEAGTLSWEEVECQGACVNAPMVMIFKDAYEDLTPERLEEIIDAFEAGRGGEIRPGPQNGRHLSAPIGGPTSLLDEEAVDAKADEVKSKRRSATMAPKAAEGGEEPTEKGRPRKGPPPEADPTIKEPAKAEGAPGMPKTEDEAGGEPVKARRPAATKDAGAKDTARKSTQSPAEKSPAAGKAAAGSARPSGIERPAEPDDLKLISGVGPKIEATLNDLGVWTYTQIAGWKKAEREWVDDHLRFSGRIERDDWVKQAKALAKGGEAEYIRVFGKKPR
jgi:NADH-quinone oxidoreductase subunit E